MLFHAELLEKLTDEPNELFVGSTHNSAWFYKNCPRSLYSLYLRVTHAF